jgi:ferredoxin
MLKTLTNYFQYLISCPKCQNCWSASRQEVIDLDTVTCQGCGSCNLNIKKYYEV